ncbi:hypothetical protein ZIOFF_013344 [Zingiber officinale]|uniref:Polyprotein n=1 Tax=Zingiber officinale TaxID=94328 RepID=A0A8J5LQ43_ZINOF|nr:hypothetical protein ZIOFF_013344 [Zingiber officinale]
MEKVCAYAQGKFPVVKSVIDAEIYAAMETMSALKIPFLDKREITLRMDCQAIISFHNKSTRNKPSRVRWIAFPDYITDIGVKINFEHIDGKLNVLADTLSRLVEGREIVAVLIDDAEEAASSTRFLLLTKYEDLIHDTLPKILLKEEHNKRHLMAKIEDEAIINVLEKLRELELIQQMKEYDFNRRQHMDGGQQSYWKKNLDTVRESQKDLWNEIQRIQ